MLCEGKSMGKIKKVKENYLFRRAYSRGKALVCPYAVVYVMKTKGNNVRLGITAGKKIGNAVKRNRAKRVITAAFAECYPNITQGNDIIIVARTRILSVKSTILQKELEKLFVSSGVYQKMFEDENIID